MRLSLTTLLTAMTLVTAAQSQKPCVCMYTLHYPQKAVDSGISGKILVKIDEDTNGIWSNPVVVKGLGYGCDEEALRVTNTKIKCHNTCGMRYKPEEKRKVYQVVNFELPAAVEPASKSRAFSLPAL